jgi:serine/threonine protein kinase
MSEGLDNEQRLALSDRIRQRLVDGFRHGSRVRIEDLLIEVPESLRGAALEELIAEEVIQRNLLGEQPTMTEYESRFGGNRNHVARGFRRIDKNITLPSDLNKTGDLVDHELTATLIPSKFDDDQLIPDSIGRYEVVRMLGAGSYGRVFMAWDPQLRRNVAIKVPKRNFFARGSSVELFLEEGRLAAKVDHPGLVRVYDVELDCGWPYIVQEFIDGTSLAKWMRGCTASHLELARLLMEIADAVSTLHQRRLVHRDLKPSNILVDRSGHAHVTDFGSAVHESTQWSRAGEVAGTYRYMSPEQLRGESHLLDGRADLWSIGVMMYEMLVGESPFPANNLDDLREQIGRLEPRPPRMLVPNVPIELSRICLKCLQHRRNDRYDSANDLIDDLRHWSQVPANEMKRPLFAVAESPSSGTNTASRIIPKGLRSFDEQDADFFLDLLPGPKDRCGLPESIRFWKTRIEQRDADKTFTVGLLYGPSGCGKSSLLKAGLLPLLDKSITAVYIEASAEDTESRLLKGIRKRLPFAPDAPTLPLLLQHLRSTGLGAEQKLLLLIDQFEQWLVLHGRDESSPLIDALRQCDGTHIQSIVLVRDDFWMAAAAFMRSVESKLDEGRNSLGVEPFRVRHAEEVMKIFGRAFGTLPAETMDQTPEQTQFVQQAVAGLASAEGKVICVHLSLFAEMMKGRPWTPKSLKDVGGTKGVGVTFLDEVLGSSTAPPEYRLHQKAAREVLKSLLPDALTEIKGNKRSYEQLLNASGYARRPRDFADLLTILDSDLRLITPTDPEEHSCDPIEMPSASGEKHYQLTHDYLVPSLREWLNRKQQESRKGRAELKLAERANIWSSKKESKQLPTVLEWLAILLMTRYRDWTIVQRNMMFQAARLHGLTWGGLILLALVAGIWIRRRNESDLQVQTQEAINALEIAGGPNLKRALSPLSKLPNRLVVPELKKRFSAAKEDQYKLPLAFGLAHFGKVEVDYLLSQIDRVGDEDIANLQNSLSRNRPRALESLKAEAANCEQSVDWPRLAKLASSSALLGDLSILEMVCKERPNPEQRSLFIDEFHRWQVDTNALRQAIVESPSEAVKTAICLAIGRCDYKRVSEHDRQAWVELAKKWFWEPSGATHSAADWLLRTWNENVPEVKDRNEMPKWLNNPTRSWFQNSIGSTMIHIRPGTLNLHDKEIGITDNLWVASTEVSVAQIDAFIKDRGYGYDRFQEWQGVDVDVSPTPAHPAQKVSYYDAVMFCNWLSRKEFGDYSYCYEKTGKKVTNELDQSDQKKYETWWLVPERAGYRLLLENEWEYMCRAGTVTRFSCGDDEDLLPAYCEMAPAKQTVACGTRLPNPWGFFDAHGNVIELCEDSKNGVFARGGGFSERAKNCQSNTRFPLSYAMRVKNYGFRICLVLPERPTSD